jgi:hypothetical protein
VGVVAGSWVGVGVMVAKMIGVGVGIDCCLVAPGKALMTNPIAMLSMIIKLSM